MARNINRLWRILQLLEALVEMKVKELHEAGMSRDEIVAAFVPHGRLHSETGNVGVIDRILKAITDG